MNNNKPYFFLDIDGVLATTMQYYTNRKKWHPAYECYRFDETCVRVFNSICDRIQPIIILSSDWKLDYNLQQLNEIFTWNKIIYPIQDVTPNLWGTEYTSLQQLEACRSAEILKYVNEHQICNYIAVDDLDLSPWITNFVRTPRSNEGIKQSGIKDKILKVINN